MSLSPGKTARPPARSSPTLGASLHGQGRQLVGVAQAEQVADSVHGGREEAAAGFAVAPIDRGVHDGMAAAGDAADATGPHRGLTAWASPRAMTSSRTVAVSTNSTPIRLE